MAITTSFEEYIINLIQNIQLVNINDTCKSLSINWAYENTIPTDILNQKQLSLVKIAKDNCLDRSGVDVNLLHTLKPLQDWLVNNICKAIQKKEIEPLVLGVLMEGEVDPSRTYVDDSEIRAWLGHRGLNEHIYNYEFSLNENLEYCLNSIINCVLDNSCLLSDIINCQVVDKAEESPYEQPYLEIHRINKLEIENKKLKSQLREGIIKSENKHAERHATKREQVLGAALSVLVKFPNLCTNKSNKVMATNVCRVIEEQALLFWPDTGQPPLGRDTIENLIRDWFKKTG